MAFLTSSSDKGDSSLELSSAETDSEYAVENQEIPSDILQEILMKLPTKDVTRCCCVSRQWRSALGDLSFRKLHAASPAALSAEPELLRLSSVPYGFSHSIKTVLNVSTGKSMRSSIVITGGYYLLNVCNGLLCFVDDDRDAQAPALVFNPATGETLALPEALSLPLSNKDRACHLFAFGFSPPTKEYKLFRLSFPPYSYTSEKHKHLYKTFSDNILSIYV